MCCQRCGRRRCGRRRVDSNSIANMRSALEVCTARKLASSADYHAYVSGIAVVTILATLAAVGIA